MGVTFLKLWDAGIFYQFLGRSNGLAEAWSKQNEIYIIV